MTAREHILEQLQAHGARRVAQLAEDFEGSINTIYNALDDLKRTGQIVPVATGRYRLAGQPSEPAARGVRLPRPAGQRRTIEQQVLDAVAEVGTADTDVLLGYVDASRQTIQAATSALARRGLLVRVKKGHYALPDAPAESAVADSAEVVAMASPGVAELSAAMMRRAEVEQPLDVASSSGPPLELDDPERLEVAVLSDGSAVLWRGDVQLRLSTLETIRIARFLSRAGDLWPSSAA